MSSDSDDLERAKQLRSRRRNRHEDTESTPDNEGESTSDPRTSTSQSQSDDEDSHSTDEPGSDQPVPDQDQPEPSPETSSPNPVPDDGAEADATADETTNDTGSVRTRDDRSEVDGELEKFLTFSLDGENYGVHLLNIQEIISYLDVTPLPQTPDFVKGFVNLRGTVIPIVDLAARLGLDEVEVGEETCIIVLENRSGTNSRSASQIGAVVDDVNQVLDLPSSRIDDVPEFGASIETDFIDGMGKDEDDQSVTVLLDVEEVLTFDLDGLP